MLHILLFLFPSHDQSHEVDRIVVPSEFSKWVFENTSYQIKISEEETRKVGCGAPVSVVNYPIKTLDTDKDFIIDLPCEKNYLVVSQWSTRKNMDNCIKWFLEEFKNEKVGLVLKTSLAKNCYFDRVATQNKIQQLLVDHGLGGEDVKCKVHLIHGDLTQEQMNSLFPSHDPGAITGSSLYAASKRGNPYPSPCVVDIKAVIFLCEYREFICS